MLTRSRSGFDRVFIGFPSGLLRMKREKDCAGGTQAACPIVDPSHDRNAGFTPLRQAKACVPNREYDYEYDYEYMATLIPNSLVGILHGKLGNLVFVRGKDGRIWVRHRPVRQASITPGELKGQGLLAAANRYVGEIRQQPERYAIYRSAARLAGKRDCDLAKADFFHAPIIEDIDLSAYTGAAGEAIRVQARDDFEVMAVEVAVSDIGGIPLEQGSAMLDAQSGRWIYVTQGGVSSAQSIVVVAANASDRAGKIARKRVDHAVGMP